MLAAPPYDGQRRFVVAVLNRLVRLSYWDRVKSVLPPEFGWAGRLPCCLILTALFCLIYKAGLAVLCSALQHLAALGSSAFWERKPRGRGVAGEHVPRLDSRPLLPPGASPALLAACCHSLTMHLRPCPTPAPPGRRPLLPPKPEVEPLPPANDEGSDDQEGVWAAKIVQLVGRGGAPLWPPQLGPKQQTGDRPSWCCLGAVIGDRGSSFLQSFSLLRKQDLASCKAFRCAI